MDDLLFRSNVTAVKEAKTKMESDVKISLQQTVKITNGVNANQDFPDQPL